ncbi:hypothetical protein, partial [Clostridium perfringens]|uniref:hypothetical protein n=1 Tax=Clostridium perfringens TaxID=1502 RepID=UPI0019CF9344
KNLPEGLSVLILFWQKRTKKPPYILLKRIKNPYSFFKKRIKKFFPLIELSFYWVPNKKKQKQTTMDKSLDPLCRH